eukprot:760499-Hanusia_phi.AAC.9
MAEKVLACSILPVCERCDRSGRPANYGKKYGAVDEGEDDDEKLMRKAEGDEDPEDNIPSTGGRKQLVEDVLTCCSCPYGKEVPQSCVHAAGSDRSDSCGRSAGVRVHPICS